jgi:hypothetical protein
MPISGWIGCIFISLLAIGGGVFLYCMTEKYAVPIIAVIVAVALVFGVGFWYYNNTASGIRARTDERAELQNGLDRVITIYTADGTVLKQYEGKIDIEQDQGYIKFDWNGKRYIYYNCYVETIADIK